MGLGEYMNRLNGLLEQESTALDQLVLFSNIVFGRKPAVLYDVGSRFGSVSVYLASRIPLSEIVAFEPQAHLATELALSLEGTGVPYSVTTRAVGAANSFEVFYRNADEGTSSLLRPTDSLASVSGYYECVEELTTEVITLDSFVSSGRAKPDILKIDAQGADLDVLTGSADLLSSSQPSIIYLEGYVSPAYEGAADIFDIGLHLRSFDYRLCRIPRIVEAKAGNIYFGDFLFLSRPAMSSIGSF